jgi:(S)-ureidoglycine aminohydrolase
VHDFEWMQVTANNLDPSSLGIKQMVPDNEEHLLIIKSGTLLLKLADSSYMLTPGSVAVLMPGERFLIKSTKPCSYYRFKYRSKAPMDFQRGIKNGGSFVKIWEAIPFVTNNIGGGRRDFFNKPTAMQRRFEMHVTTLKEGIKSHEPHIHRAEEIVLIIDGETEMQLGDKIVSTGIGGFYYLGSNVSHAIKNIGTKSSIYFAFQFE